MPWSHGGPPDESFFVGGLLRVSIARGSRPRDGSRRSCARQGFRLDYALSRPRADERVTVRGLNSACFGSASSAATTRLRPERIQLGWRARRDSNPPPPNSK